MSDSHHFTIQHLYNNCILSILTCDSAETINLARDPAGVGAQTSSNAPQVLSNDAAVFLHEIFAQQSYGRPHCAGVGRCLRQLPFRVPIYGDHVEGPLQ